MSIDFGTFVARTLQANPANWDSVLIKRNAPYATADHNLQADIDSSKNAQQLTGVASGLVKLFLGSDPDDVLGTRNSLFPVIGDKPNEFAVQGFTAKVGRLFTEVRGARVNNASEFNAFWNFIKLPDPPATGIRYDLVFLEVWRAVVETGNVNVGVIKPASDKVWPLGNVQWGDTATLIDEDFVDPLILRESSGRVQIQYRIRVVPGVAKISDPLVDPIVTAQGAMMAPVAGWPFISTDKGLFTAGDGTATARLALGTPDGEVFAIPLFLIVRRNTQGFDQAGNKNGGSVSIADILTTGSDRVDGIFGDEITTNDIVADLRHFVSLANVDFQATVEREFLKLMAGDHQFDGKLDGFGTVDASELLLQIDGIAAAPGQVGIDDVAEPDSFRRIFSDAPRSQDSVATIVEGVLETGGEVEFFPTFPGTAPPVPNGSDKIVQIVAPLSPVGSTVSIGPSQVHSGDTFASYEPVLRWKTSGLEVALTQLGQSTATLDLRRLMTTKEGNRFEEIRAKGVDTFPDIEIDGLFSQSATGAIIVGAEEPFNEIRFEVQTGNTLTGDLDVDVLVNGIFINVAVLSDTTKVGGASLGQTGEIKFALPGDLRAEVFEGGPPLFYVRVRKDVTPGVSFGTLVSVIEPQYVSEFWNGFGTGKLFAQLDETDANFALGDEIDVTFSIGFKRDNGLSFVVENMLKGWRNDGSLLHDLAFVKEENKFREKVVDQTLVIGSNTFEFRVRDFNVLHQTYEKDFGGLRLLVAFAEADGTANIVVPASHSPAIFGPGVTAPVSVRGFFKFEKETLPGSQTFIDAEVAPIGGVIRNPGGTYTVTFTSAIPAGTAIRYEAFLETDGFVHEPLEKGISETVRLEELSEIAVSGAQTVFEFEASGEILSFETAFNPTTTVNQAVAWVDTAPPAGSFTRQVINSASIKNRKRLILTFGSPPGAGSDVRVSVVVAKPIGVLEAWQLAYQHKPYQGMQVTPTEEYDVLAVSKNQYIHSIGTGRRSTLAQRDPRFGSLSARMPIPAAVDDSMLLLDAFRLVDSQNSGPFKRVSTEVNYNDPMIGTELREGSVLKIVDDGTATMNALRGISDHSVRVIDSFTISDIFPEFLLKKFEIATDVMGSLRGLSLITAALVRSRETGELFNLIVTAFAGKSSQFDSFRATSTDVWVAFDLFRTEFRLLD